ncbi:MAG: hypothetical protein ACREDQ_09805 [Limisphaerales bacterium]
MKTNRLFIAFLILSGLLVAGYPVVAETTHSNSWGFAWHNIAEPAGGYTVVQTFLRAPIPPDKKEATKEEWDEHFRGAPEGEMSAQLHTGYNTTNGAKLMSKYFRGPIYTSTNLSAPWESSVRSQESWFTVVSTLDNTRLAVGVDNGPIYFSTNSGVTWETITSPGKHSLLIVSGDGESGVFAVQTILTHAQHATATLARHWYAVASGSDGSGLIISGSDSPSPPVLNISTLETQIILSWPASFTGYALQENSDLTTTNWVGVTVAPSVLNGFNRVILPRGTPHKFYRLKK